MSNLDLVQFAMQRLCNSVTMLTDSAGMPSLYARIPKFTLDTVIDGADAVTHPAFIVDGVEVDEIYISLYQNIIQDGCAYSLPGQDPARGVTFAEACAACEAKGAGFHLMTNAEWAALALWCGKNGLLPLGNNDDGKDVSEAETVAVLTEDGTGRVLTGSGPVEWSHNRQPGGIWDLNGNLHEWVAGVRMVAGEIQVLPNNNAADSANSQAADSAQWQAVAEDGTLVAPGTTGTLKYDYVAAHDEVGDAYDFQLVTALTYGQTTESPMGVITFSGLAAADGVSVPVLLQALGLMPVDGMECGTAVMKMQNIGEKLLTRGGWYESGADAGIFRAGALSARDDATMDTGFRSAYVAI